MESERDAKEKGNAIEGRTVEGGRGDGRRKPSAKAAAPAVGGVSELSARHTDRCSGRQLLLAKEVGKLKRDAYKEAKRVTIQQQQQQVCI